MWIQFAYTNIHFGLNIFAGFVFFLIGWLFFDAWQAQKNLKNFLKALGFLLISFAFLAHSTVLESDILISSIINSNITETVTHVLKNLGLLLVIVGLVIDPLQKRPSSDIGKNQLRVVAISGFSMSIKSVFLGLSPILSSVVALLFLRQATLGYENHLKKVSLGFFLFSISEVLRLASLFRFSNNSLIYELVAPYKSMWLLEHALLFASILILGRWAVAYLLKRLQSQLFIIFITFVTAIFMVTTVTFTSLLLKDLQKQATSQIETNGKVLQYALDAKGSERVSDAEGFASLPELSKYILEENRQNLFEAAQKYLLSKNLDTLQVINSDGKVIVSGSDRDNYGQSLSDNGLFVRASAGEPLYSIQTSQGVVSPQISILGAAPVKDAKNAIVGIVIASSLIDNAFVDGIENSTGLTASIYSGTTLSATTLETPDGESRANGTLLDNESVTSTVLASGTIYSGLVTVLNTEYSASVLPLKDINGNPIGMIFVGNPQLELLQTASQSIQLTFVVAALLILLAIFPSMVIAKKITDQIS